MFRFLCKSFLHSGNGYSSITPHNPLSMVASSSLIRYFSSDSDTDRPHSFTLSYLTKTCGLSPKSALSASKKFRFESSEKPDSVLSCLQNFGFSKPQITEMITKYPKMLCCKPEKTIAAKVEFFRSKGVSTPEIITIITVNPWLLGRSLENALVPNFNILIEMFQSEEKAIEVIKQNPFALQTPKAAHNVNALRENGVPSSNVVWLIQHHWLCIGMNSVKFGEAVEKAKEMGFDPLKLRFVIAVMVLTISTKSKWDGRVEVYKRWGWSDEDITTAFKKYPLCMATSEDKIMAIMDFYVNKLGLESSLVANCPKLLSYSLKKRLIPRGAVIRYLFSKGLLELDSRIANMFECTEKSFLERYSKSFKEEAPHFIKLYNEKLKEATGEANSKS